MKIDFTKTHVRDGEISYCTNDKIEIKLYAKGGGLVIPQINTSSHRYVIGDVIVKEEHSVAMMFRCFLPNQTHENIFFRFGLLPKFKTRICLDLNLLDCSTIFTNRTPGTLKLVVHGQRTNRNEVERFELGIEKTFHDVTLSFENFYLSDEMPEEFPIPDIKLVDEFGQWKRKDWPSKIYSFSQLKDALQKHEGDANYPFVNWNKWGGDKTRKLTEGTGFFRTYKDSAGRWHLVDPDGCDYFSVGPCGVNPGDECRIDHFEKLCDYLPDVDGPEFKDFYRIGERQRAKYMPKDYAKTIFFTGINLKRVYGNNWYEKWEELTYNILKKYGLNTIGNFSGIIRNNRNIQIPYVRQLYGFPTTETLIFRDFPDVLAPEYQLNSEKFASQLTPYVDDPYMIGYFLRNEPEFAFVENIAIVDEVLHNPAQTYCRSGFIKYLKDKYQTIERLNAAWDSDFHDFADLNKPIEKCSARYPKSTPDIRHYSALLIKEYIRIPSECCRKVDKNHLNLGLRWATANNHDMMSGWEYFDVFSINCYSFDPTNDLNFVANAKVDLPIMIGEFHCGALDRGLPATGLKGVENQEERGKMWRYFVERVASHPQGVGAHWFQFNDQFCLGRYDGENYQIGLVDICMQPYKELMEAVYETSKVIYAVKNGERAPYATFPKAIPMIGY